MIQDYDFEIAIPNVPRAVSMQGNYLEVVEALGTLTLNFSPGFTTTVKKGDVLRSDQFPTEFDGFQLSSDTANDVIRLKAGRGFSLSLSWLREQMDALIAAIVAIPATVVNIAMTWVEAGTQVPLQSTNGQDLAVGGLLTLPGVFGAGGGPINTKGVSFMRIVVQASGVNGDYLTLVDGTDTTMPPLIIYDERGNIARADGRLYFNNVVGETYSPTGKVYFVDVRGIGSVALNAGIGTPAFAFYLAPIEKLPTKVGVRQVMLNATDCGVVLGAYPAGVANIFNVNNLKAIFTRLGMTPKRMRLLFHATPLGADTYQELVGFRQNGFDGQYQQPFSGAVTAVPWIFALGVNDSGYNSSQQVMHAETFGNSYAAQIPAGSGGTASVSMVTGPIDDIGFVFRNSTGNFGGTLTDFSLLLEE